MTAVWSSVFASFGLHYVRFSIMLLQYYCTEIFKFYFEYLLDEVMAIVEYFIRHIICRV